MTNNNKRQTFLGYFLAAIAAVGWSTGGLLSNWLMTKASPATQAWIIQPLGFQIEPSHLSGARALSATIILGMGLLLLRRSAFVVNSPLKSLPFLSALGVTMAGMHFTYFAAIRSSNVPTAILLEYMAPVLTLGFAVLFLKARVSWSAPFAVVLAILGAAITVGAFDAGGLKISLAGLLWGLSAAVTFATYSQLGSMGSGKFSSFTLLFYGLFFATLMWFAVLGPGTVLAVFAEPLAGLSVILMAVFATIIPFAAFLMSLKYISATHAAVTAMLEPVIAAIGSWLLYGTALDSSLVIGGGIIIAAIVLIQLSGSVPVGELASNESLELDKETHRID